MKWGGVKNWSKLTTDSTKKLPDMREGGVMNSEKLPTSFMDGPHVLILFLYAFRILMNWREKVYKVCFAQDMFHDFIFRPLGQKYFEIT